MFRFPGDGLSATVWSACLCLAAGLPAAQEPAPPASPPPATAAPATAASAAEAGIPSAKPAAIRLALHECLEIAIQNNLGLHMARLQDRRSDWSLAGAYALYLPTLTGGLSAAGSTSAGFSSNRSNTLALGVSQPTPWGTEFDLTATETEGAGGKSAGLVGAVRQPLLKGAGRDAGMKAIREARLRRLMQRSQLELSLQDLIYRTRTNYADCVTRSQAVEVNRRAVESARTFLELTRARERAGQVTRLQVLDAEVQVGQRERDLISSQGLLETSFDTLKLNLDVDLEEPVQVVEEPVDFGESAAPGEERVLEADVQTRTVRLVARRGGARQGEPLVLFQAVPQDETRILAEAFQNRLDLLNARRATALQRLNVLLAEDGLQYQVDLTGSYGLSGSGADWGQAHSLKNDNFSLALNVTIPWGKVSDRAAYEQALLDLQNAVLGLKDLRNTVHGQVRQSLRDLRELEQRVLIQAKVVELAKRSLEASRVSFERGLERSIDVIQKEESLLRAKTDFLTQRQQYVITLARLEKIVGLPTGRVNLDGEGNGGRIESALPESLDNRPLPRRAPSVPPAPADEP
jgi:outer membrane protein TolC